MEDRVELLVHAQCASLFPWNRDERPIQKPGPRHLVGVVELKVSNP